MDHFTFARYTFTIRAETPLFLPAYKGSTLRGGFGHAFKRACCTTRNKECSDCLLSGKCVYSWVFETPIPADADMMRKYTAAPHPFVLEPPDDKTTSYEKGDSLDFGLTLLGRAVDYLPYFIYAFHELGKIGIGKDRGKFTLEKVIEKPHPQTWENLGKVVYRGETQTLDATGPPITWSEIVETDTSDKARISFQTPTRIKYRNRLTKDLDFHVLFRNLLRRISLLSYFHCGHRLDDREFKDLIEQAESIETVNQDLRWQDWSRWSHRQEARMKMGGVMGEATYDGDLEPFWPYLRLGQYLHIGKGSSFGLGKYEIN